jgi:transcriptional regulator with XRE-family HTH domain
MKKAHELPQAVNNLRAIWDQKKAEMKFTQVEAAGKLGWSQSAVSHYLNNITELGPAAVIKFANFLCVDPVEIDPNVQEFLPHTRTRIIKYDASNLSKQINVKYYDTHPPSSFWVKTDASIFTYRTGSSNKNATWFTHVCPPKDHPNASIFMVQAKGQKEARIYKKEDLPPDSDISKKFAVLETEVNNSITD